MGLAFAWTKRPLLTFLCKIKKPAFRAVSSVSLKTELRTVIISASRGMVMCWYLGSAPRVTFYWNNLLTVSQNVAEPAPKENSLGWNLSSTKLCDFGDLGPPLNPSSDSSPVKEEKLTYLSSRDLCWGWGELFYRWGKRGSVNCSSGQAGVWTPSVCLESLLLTSTL